MNWNSAANPSILDTGEVHIWRADLHQIEDRMPFLESFLSSDEEVRSKAFFNQKDRIWFILRRGLLRSIIGQYTGKLPSALHFQRGDYGKPIIVISEGKNKLSFNISHSRGIAVYAFTRDVPVGVDVEFTNRKINFEELARRYFSPDESQVLQKPSVETIRKKFFQIWTLKEAYVKGLGRGVSYPLDRFSISLKEGLIHELMYDFETPSEKGKWEFHLFSPADGFCGALAVRSIGNQIRYWDVHVTE